MSPEPRQGPGGYMRGGPLLLGCGHCVAGGVARGAHAGTSGGTGRDGICEAAAALLSLTGGGSRAAAVIVVLFIVGEVDIIHSVSELQAVSASHVAVVGNEAGVLLGSRRVPHSSLQ